MSGAAAEVVKSAVPVADLSAIDRALSVGGGTLAEALRHVRPADVGRDLSRRSVAQASKIVLAADDRHAAAMMIGAHPMVAANVITSLPPQKAAHLLTCMPTEHVVAILGNVKPALRATIEAALPPPEREQLTRGLAYPSSSVARMMSPKIWRVPKTATVSAALALLKAHADDIEVAQNAYVVDDAGKLLGVIALRELAVLDGAVSVAEHMTKDVIAVAEDTDQKDAAEIIQVHDFLSLPVIDKEGKLVGAVRVDDLLDVALQSAGAELLNQGAVAGKIAAAVPYFQQRIHRVVRSRVTWLVLLFVAETATGTVLRHFEDELARVVALSFFIPLIIGTGGNAGSQTVSTVIRALAVGEVRFQDAWRVLLKEVATGLALGVLLGAIAFGRALIWGVSPELAICVAITILVVCTWANTVGSLIPLVAQRVGIDPTVVSAPLITTLVDASGLFIYLTVAGVMISSLHEPPVAPATAPVVAPASSAGVP